jgi:hypothetical protein
LALKAVIPAPQELAALCLNYLVDNPEHLAEFMGISGLDPRGLRDAIGTRSFANGLIDYVASNEPLLLAICAANSLQPETVMRVWAKLNPTG